MGKTVIVSGSTNWDDYESIARELRELRAQGYSRVVNGGRPGADRLSSRVASTLGMELVELQANKMWWGPGAQFVLNSNMVKMKPDMLLVFHYNYQDSAVLRDLVRKVSTLEVPVKNIVL